MGITERRGDGTEIYYPNGQRISQYRLANILGVPDSTINKALGKERGKVGVLVGEIPGVLGILAQLRSATFFGDYSYLESLKDIDLSSDFRFVTPTGTRISFEREEEIAIEKPFECRAFNIYFQRFFESPDHRETDRARRFLRKAVKLNSHFRKNRLDVRQSRVLDLSFGLKTHPGSPFSPTEVGKKLYPHATNYEVKRVQRIALTKVWKTPGVRNLLTKKDLEEIEKLRKHEESESQRREKLHERIKKERRTRSQTTRVKIAKEMTKVWQKPEQQDRKKKLSDQMKSDRWKEIRANRWRGAKEK